MSEIRIEDIAKGRAAEDAWCELCRQHGFSVWMTAPAAHGEENRSISRMVLPPHHPEFGARGWWWDAPDVVIGRDGEVLFLSIKTKHPLKNYSGFGLDASDIPWLDDWTTLRALGKAFGRGRVALAIHNADAGPLLDESSWLISSVLRLSEMEPKVTKNNQVWWWEPSIFLPAHDFLSMGKPRLGRWRAGSKFL